MRSGWNGQEQRSPHSRSTKPQLWARVGSLLAFHRHLHVTQQEGRRTLAQGEGHLLLLPTGHPLHVSRGLPRDAVGGCGVPGLIPFRTVPAQRSHPQV